MVAGPYCGQMLADMGAEVIKIEGIEGDGLRAVRPEHAGLGSLFVQNNRGKKSIALDVKSPEGLAICRDIAEAHGGRLVAESRPGEGATFRLSIPERQHDTSHEPLPSPRGGMMPEPTPAMSPQRPRGAAANDRRA